LSPEQIIQHLNDVLLVGAGYKGCNLGQFFGKRGAVAGGQTTRYHQPRFPRSNARQIKGLQYRGDSLFSCLSDKRAGVHNNRIGCGSVGHHLKAGV
jgi:hypothetical protein